MVPVSFFRIRADGTSETTHCLEDGFTTRTSPIAPNKALLFFCGLEVASGGTWRTFCSQPIMRLR
jgi:hypothetical protein